MSKIKKILFPTDFSEMAAQGYLYCLHIAKQLGASVDVLHIYRTDLNIPTTSDFGLKMLEQRKQNIALELGKFAKLETNKQLAKEVDIKLHTQLGLASDVIVEYANSNAIDLIIMPTKGEHNIIEVLFGSTTTATVARANCPVLIIPENYVYHPIKNIAYTINIKDEKTADSPLPITLTKLYDAALYYIYIYDKDPASEAEINDVLAQNSSELNVHFHQIKNKLIENGISSFLKEKEVDLLVSYSPQKSFFERFFHLSTTRHIIEQIKSPMLVLK